MRFEADRQRQPDRPAPSVIRVQRTVRGRWEVLLPGRRKGIACETLDDARRVAYLAVAHARPCELVIHDAYHRVIHRELIAGRDSLQPEPPQPRGAHRRAAPPLRAP